MTGRAILMLWLLAGPALAQDVPGAQYYPPAGCTGLLTVQSRGCEVNHIYACEADAPGETWRIVFEADGPTYLSKIDAETQWLDSYSLFPASREILIQPSADPASLTELLETGIDSFDFRTQSDSGVIERVVGFDRLTGESVVIDGEPLLRTEFETRHIFSDGYEYRMTGRQYVSVAHRRFLSGLWRLEEDGNVQEWDNSPVDFIYPGEPGFFHKRPLYDCEANLARYSLPEEGSDP